MAILPPLQPPTPHPLPLSPDHEENDFHNLGRGIRGYRNNHSIVFLVPFVQIKKIFLDFIHVHYIGPTLRPRT